MSLDLRHFPLVDHHCHSLLDASQKTNVERLLRVTSEAPGNYPLTDLRETVTWEAIKTLVREATGKQAETDDELTAVFQSLDYDTYCRKLFSSRGYESLFADTGFSPSPGMSPTVLASTTGTSVYPILRLEQVAQELRTPGKSFEAWLEEFLHRVGSAREDGYIGAKSIAAYRIGLGVHEVSPDDAKTAYARWQREESVRLAEPDLLNFMLWEAAPLLIRQQLPLQFHTGYGDPDEDLLKGNPLLLRAFIEAFCLKGLSITLLHTYPYHREAGYLASVYPGVYFDVSLIIPLGTTSARRVMAESLEVSPVSRFLFASDAHTRPEMFALSADLFRDALEHYYKEEVISRYVASEKVSRWCEMILSENAKSLYLGGSSS